MAANWGRLGTVFIVVGFEVFLFGMATTRAYQTTTIEALLITAFVLYLAAFILMVFIHFGGFEENKIPNILVTVLAFLAGVMLLIGVIVYCAKYDSKPPTYPTTLFVSGSLLAIMGGLISLLSFLKVLK